MENQGNKAVLNLTPIYSGDKTSIDFSFCLKEGLPVSKDIILKSPVLVSGKVYEKTSAKRKGENYVELTLTITVDYAAKCSRCLADIPRKFELTATYGVSESLANEESETDLLSKDGKIDISELCESLFLLNLPTKFLCSESCKGLCPGCGADLNFEECRCSKAKVDPRLAVLKKMLDKRENE